MPCALCHSDEDLRLSHIVPEFLHRPIYDEKHRLRSFGHSQDAPKLLQKGIRERLLCGSCEERIQKFEDYFAKFWYQACPLPDGLSTRDIVHVQFDYTRFKLFLLSIVWRASVATGETFASADLGPHESVLREMLLKGAPGNSSQYRIHAGLIIDPDTGAVWDKALLSPLKFRLEGLWSYRLVFGGASWTVVIARNKSAKIDSLCLRDSGQLPMPCVEWQAFARASGLVEAVSAVPSRLTTRRS